MRYLIIPDRDPALSMVSAMDIKLDPASRRRQYQELLQLRRRPMGLQDTVAAAARIADESPAYVVATPAERTPVTGITIIEATADEAAELSRTLSDAIVIPDLPLSLIFPERPATATTEADAWHLSAILLEKARKGGFNGKGNGVVVAITDTGIEEVDEIKGRITASYEVDAPNNRTIPLNATHDTEGHGTHVAGLVCGKTVGVAPGAQVENVIMIPGGFGNISNFIIAVEHCARQPHIAVMNMSAGIPGYSGVMQTAISNLWSTGVLPVIAIGNEGINTSRSPGNYSTPLSVGASNRNNKVANFSSGGQMSVEGMLYAVPDCVAPGQGVTSCVMGGGYEAWNGTSMATPIVSGLAALIIERHPTISLLDLEQEILGSCTDLDLPVTRQGHGLVQVPPSLWQQVAAGSAKRRVAAGSVKERVAASSANDKS